jgi:hypothetical protein
MQACAIQPMSAGGSESLGNFLQLCPNQHHAFDSGKCTIGADKLLEGIEAEFELHPAHDLDLDALRHHREKVYENAQQGARATAYVRHALGITLAFGPSLKICTLVVVVTRQNEISVNPLRHDILL